MSVSVLIPTTLRAFAQSQSEIELEGENVGEVLNALADNYPEIKKTIFDEDGKIRAFVNVFVGDTNIKELNQLDTPIKDGDEIMLIPAIAGGSGEEDDILGDRELDKLTNDEIARYSRHLLLKEVGVKGQKRLKASKVLIVGMGGLGAPLAQYLAAAGVGTLGLIDYDEVDTSNLQRQVIYRTRDVGRPKVAAAKDFIKGLNPLVKVETYDYSINAENILDIVKEYDVIADATDNFKARYLINDACVLLKKPDVFGAMYQFEGQVTVYHSPIGPCYRCMYPSPPPAGLVPSCSTGGVMGVLPGIIGTIQANEIIKLIVGSPHTLTGRLLSLDAWRMKFRELKITRDEACPVCGKSPTILEPEEYDYDGFCGLRAAPDEKPIVGIEAKELKRRLDDGEKITIIDIREPHERAIVKFPDAKIIPIGQLVRRQKELDPNVDTVFICKEGKRSQLAIRTLEEAGYQGRMFNLKDGINTWARDVDKTMPQY